MAPVVVDPRSIRAFESEVAFEAWLRTHHDVERELYLRIYKKGANPRTVTYREALDVALCWGWIDGLKKSYDQRSFLQRFSPRGSKSVWSQINREHVARLIETGRMTPHGLRHVEAAKADGRWQNAYAGARKMTMPKDLLEAIEQNKEAHATYAKLDKTNLYAMAFRVGNLKTVSGRAKKIASLVELLARGEMLHRPRAKK